MMHSIFQFWPFVPAIFFSLFARELAKIILEKEDPYIREIFVLQIAMMYLLLGTVLAYILWTSDMRGLILSWVGLAGLPQSDFFMVYLVAFAAIFICSVFSLALRETKRKRSLRTTTDI
jgi:hypothetical protein